MRGARWFPLCGCLEFPKASCFFALLPDSKKKSGLYFSFFPRGETATWYLCCPALCGIASGSLCWHPGRHNKQTEHCSCFPTMLPYSGLQRVGWEPVQPGQDYCHAAGPPPMSSTQALHSWFHIVWSHICSKFLLIL